MSLASSYDEKALLLRMSAGDEQAFNAIYQYHAPAINSFVIKFMKSPHLAEDTTQEIFMKLWELRSDAAAIQSLRSYLLAAARNHTLNILKRAASQEAAIGEIVRHIPLVKNETADSLITREYLQYIRDTLDSLPPQTREVFRLCREQHKSYDETAALLGISRNAVKKHMVRANKAFRDSVGNELGISLGIVLTLLSKL